MKRTTISLPEDLSELVELEARRRGTSTSEVIRTSVRRDLAGTGRRTIAWAGLCDDPELPPAAELENALEGWDEALDRRRR